MTFPLVVIGIVTAVIGSISFGVAIGRYIERLTWNKLIWQGKLPKSKKTPNRFGNPIVEGKYYDAGNQE